jgi:hypothetical protein
MSQFRFDSLKICVTITQIRFDSPGMWCCDEPKCVSIQYYAALQTWRRLAQSYRNTNCSLAWSLHRESRTRQLLHEGESHKILPSDCWIEQESIIKCVIKSNACKINPLIYFNCSLPISLCLLQFSLTVSTVHPDAKSEQTIPYVLAVLQHYYCFDIEF